MAFFCLSVPILWFSWMRCCCAVSNSFRVLSYFKVSSFRCASSSVFSSAMRCNSASLIAILVASCAASADLSCRLFCAFASAVSRASNARDFSCRLRRLSARSSLRLAREASSAWSDSSNRLTSSASAVVADAVASSTTSGRSSGGSKRASASMLSSKKSQMTSIRVLFMI